MKTTEPTIITEGERLQWRKTLPDYPASLWTLQYRFRGNGTGFDESCTADGDVHVADIADTVTTAMTPGPHEWQAWVTEIADSTNKIMVGSGSVTVKRGFVSGTTTAVDLRTPAKIMLDTLDAALLAAGSDDHIEYEISTPSGTKKVKRESRKDVLEQRKYWASIVANEVAKEKSRRGGGFGQQVKVRMYDE